MDYAVIEAQALAIVQAAVPEVEDNVRAWTNAGRREIQRLYNFPELLAFHPEEGNIGAAFRVDAGERRVALPTTFKEFYSRKGDLWLVKDGELTPLELWPFERIVEVYGYEDAGPEPEVFHLVRSTDGQTVYVDVFPKPTVDADLQGYAYFYLPDVDGSLSGVEDFLSRGDPLLVRDFIVREAYMALEMYDAAARIGEGLASRASAFAGDAKRRELTQSMVLRPTLRAGESRRGRRAEQGYPWWGR